MARTGLNSSVVHIDDELRLDYNTNFYSVFHTHMRIILDLFKFLDHLFPCSPPIPHNSSQNTIHAAELFENSLFLLLLTVIFLK